MGEGGILSVQDLACKIFIFKINPLPLENVMSGPLQSKHQTLKYKLYFKNIQQQNKIARIASFCRLFFSAILNAHFVNILNVVLFFVRIPFDLVVLIMVL